ncbi:corticotropin-releasing factor receptor 2-like [Antedon mediterranea]|uniref:corticotropin-releasing factor receptor 2-like n=1 Tax=Antedon mediterranea TaxID=105859 RepID=UPI003AF512F9
MMLSSITYVFIAATITIALSSDGTFGEYNVSDLLTAPTDYDNETSDILDDHQYTVEVLAPVVQAYLDQENLHPEDENAQFTTCTLWKIYEEQDLIDMQPNGTEGRYCPSLYDNITCWPPSPPGEVRLKCPRVWNGVAYKSEVTRNCYLNGTWANKANYTNCQAVTVSAVYLDIATVILYAGYSLSFVSLVIAFCIFLSFKSLRCLRNYIHWNFIASFLFLYIMFFCNHQMIKKSLDNLTVCRILMTLIIYAQCTNFFWMFVEGLYLYTLVVMALKPEKMTIIKYCLIGWGIPLIITIVYAICELQLGVGCWASVGADLYDDNGEPIKGSVEYLEFIFVGPVIAILVTNCFFLFHISFILMTKLKASHSFETKQYRKALRGIVLLLPLLGVTGIVYVFNTGGGNHPSVVISNALLHSFEGFFVVLIYVFCNQEVKRVIKRKIHHWREEQSLPTRQVSRRGSHSRQNSIVSAMYAKHNGDNNVVFDKARNNSKVGCCNFTKTQKNEGYNMMTANSFDASTRQSSLDGITSEKCFTKPGFESISEVSTGQENSYSKSENSVVYHEKHPDTNQNLKVVSNNGSVNKLPTYSESNDSGLKAVEINLTPSKEKDILTNKEQCRESSEPEDEQEALLQNRLTDEAEPRPADDCVGDGDTEYSALMTKETDDTSLSDELCLDVKHKNSMIIPKGLAIGTQL